MPRARDGQRTSPPAADTAPLWWWGGLAALGIAVATVFSPALSNGFVWDDLGNLVNNPAYRGLGAKTWAWAFTEFHAGHYQPLSWISFAVDHALWGMEPRGYHLTNLVLHAVNALLFAGIALGLLRAADLSAENPSGRDARLRVGALIAAAVFAIHPLRVESVAWATERRDVLSGLFFLLAVTFYLRAVRHGEAGRLAPRDYLAAVVVFALSLLSKAAAMSMPIVLLVLDVYPLSRHRRRSAGQLVAEKIPLFALSTISGLLALGAQSEAGAMSSAGSHGLLQRLAQAAYGAVFYVRATFLEWSWYPLYERPFRIDPFEARFVVSAVVALAVTALLIAQRKRWPALLASWVIYLALLAPVLGFAQSGFQLVADRYSYLSCLGWAVLCGAAVVMASSVRRGKALRVVAYGVATVVLLSWSVAAWRQTHVWRDEATLWKHTLDNGPSAMAYNNLGYLALHDNRRDTALDHLARALAEKPTYGSPLQNLKVLLFREHAGYEPATVERAVLAVRRTAELSPRSGTARFVLGSLLLQQANGLQGSARLARIRAARDELEAAAQLTPDEAQAWFKLGLTSYYGGELERAVAHCTRAVELEPDHPEAWLTLGLLAMERGRWLEALPAFERATELDAGNSLAWTGWGTALAQTGDVPGAAAKLTRALELDPANARARGLLARIRPGS